MISSWTVSGETALSIRVRLLCDLSIRLHVFGCSSSLVNPSHGGSVLRVVRRGRPGEWLGVLAVEHEAGGWVLAWEGNWCRASQLDQVAQQVAHRALA
ncbi:MAG: hypothetical protein ABIS86_20280 [Streptosporangiaceae bacterium]